jgi:hypothetical protein
MTIVCKLRVMNYGKIKNRHFLNCNFSSQLSGWQMFFTRLLLRESEVSYLISSILIIKGESLV